MNCCLLILNYNGREHLEECLSTALAASKNLGQPCPVVLVDNRSTENDVEYVRARFPEVEIYVAPKNDYLFSLNAVASKRSEDILVILNNDMRFDPNFLKPLLEYFESSKIFAVTAKIMDWRGNAVTQGKRMGSFQHFWFYKHFDKGMNRECFTLEACGGASAFRRRMFLELGGFDTLYRPGYCEDTDISYRAWKRGWRIVYEPRAVVYHKESATFKKIAGAARIERLVYRNEVLFTIKNCGDRKFLFYYLLLLPWRTIKNLFAGNKAHVQGFLSAVPRIPLALKRRFEQPAVSLTREKDFLEQIRLS